MEIFAASHGLILNLFPKFIQCQPNAWPPPEPKRYSNATFRAPSLELSELSALWEDARGYLATAELLAVVLRGFGKILTGGTGI